MSARFFMPEKGVPAPFGALWAHFLRGPEKSKKCSNFAYFPWWAHGPYSPGLGPLGSDRSKLQPDGRNYNQMVEITTRPSKKRSKLQPAMRPSIESGCESVSCTNADSICQTVNEISMLVVIRSVWCRWCSTL